MAFIPASEIPSLGAVPSSTVLAPGNQQAPNLSGVAQSLLAEEIQQGAFDGEMIGAQNLAQGAQDFVGGSNKVGTVLSDWQRRSKAFQDDVSLAEYDKRRSERFAKYQGTLPDKSESTYVPDWQNELKSTRDEDLKDLQLSPEGQKQLALYDIQFANQTNVKLTGEANRSAIARGTSEIMAQANRYREDGNRPEADAKLELLVHRGAIGREQADKQKAAWDAEDKQNTLTSYMTSNAKAFQEDMEKEAKGETTDLSSFFTGPDRNIEIARWRAQSEQYLRSAQSEQRQEGFSLIQSNVITNEAQLEDYFTEKGDVLDDVDKAAMKKGLLNTVGVLNVSKLNTLTAGVMQYDPKADPTGTEKARLEREIGGELPSNESKALIERLNGVVRAGRNDTTDAEASRAISNLYSNGIFGDFIDNQKARDLKGTAREKNRLAMEAADSKRAAVTDAYNQWKTQNPNATPQQAVEYVYSITKPDMQTKPVGGFWNGVMQFGAGVAAPGAGFLLTPRQPAPQTLDVQQFLEKQNKGASMNSTGQPVAKTTRYSLGADVGGPDELQDKWTNRGYSSTGQNLTPGIVAVNTKAFPMGTIFKDENGHAYIAADAHGNRDENVVDIYEPPGVYGKGKQPRLTVIGKIPRKEIPKTVSGVRQLLAQYGKVPPGASAVESLKGAA